MNGTENSHFRGRFSLFQEGSILHVLSEKKLHLDGKQRETNLHLSSLTILAFSSIQIAPTDIQLKVHQNHKEERSNLKRINDILSQDSQ